MEVIELISTMVLSFLSVFFGFGSILMAILEFRENWTDAVETILLSFVIVLAITMILMGVLIWL